MSRPYSLEQRPVVEALEPKLLYSADIAPAAFMPEASAHVRPAEQVSHTSAAAQQAMPRSELVFIDASVPDLQVLLDDIARQRDQGRDIRAEVIGANEDGIARITQALSQTHELTAIHLIGHGDPGHMQLGSTILSDITLVQRAADIAGWGQALQPHGDILLYGCDLAANDVGRMFVHDLAALTSADVAASDDLTGSLKLGADWTLEVTDGTVETRVAISVQTQAKWDHVLAATPSSKGTAVWADNSLSAVQQAAWDGQAQGSRSGTAINSHWSVITSAGSPIRDEAIVVGVDGSGNIQAERWNGTQWVAVPTNPLATGSSTDKQNFAVGYEHISGDTMVVWGSGSSLKYMTFNGTTWSAAQTVSAYGGTTPLRMQMAAQPGGDGMALIVTDGNHAERALIWNGSSWGNAVTVDTSGFTFLDDVGTSVTYESVTGRAMVVYTKFGNPNAYYRLFGHGAWTNEAAVGSFSDPALTYVTEVASDPHSNRIVLGMSSFNSNSNSNNGNGNGNGTTYTTYDSFLVWDGTSWGSRVLNTATSSSWASTVAVGFESKSGNALGVFSNGTNNVRYYSWNTTSGWSASLAGPAIAAPPGVVRLYADPATNHVVLGALNTNGALYFADWSGGAWGTPVQASANTGSTATAAFTWIWQAPDNNANDLWLGSSTNTAWPGVVSVSNTEVLSLGGPDLQLGSSTQGSFSHIFNMGAFGAAGLDDIAWVSRDVTLTSGLTLHRGDVLFTTTTSVTLSSNNSISVNNNDLVLFRPDAEGQYGTGTFTKLIQKLSGAGLLAPSSPDVKGLALVEEDFTMGDASLHAGDILFTSAAGSGALGTNVYVYSPAGTGLVGGLLSGSVATLIKGTDINIGSVITGVEVINRATTLKNVTLPAGSLLMSFAAATSVGDNNISATAQDVVLLQPTVTSLNGGTTSANASILVSGSSLGISSGTYDTLAVHRATPPTFTSASSVSVNENTSAVTTLTATDTDASAVISYRISGGVDARRFTLDSTTGALHFMSPPDFEAPTNANADNHYLITVAASNGDLESTQAMVVTVLNVNEPPVIDSNGGGATASVSVLEGQTAVTSVHATDPDSTPTYSLVGGGADNARFSINASTGVLTFITAPSFQYPDDANGDHVYNVIVMASDGSLSDTQAIDVTVTGYNVPPTNHVMSNQTITEDGSFSVSGMSVQDPDAGQSAISVTFSVSHGSLSVVANASGGLASGEMTGNGGSQVTLVGTVAKINATLAVSGAVSYQPDRDYNGSDTFVMLSDDFGHNGAAHNPAQTTARDTAALTITAVNDPPQVTANSLTVPPGGTARPTISVTDPDNTSASWLIKASGIGAGHFVDISSGLTVTQFTMTQYQSGNIVFVHDGSSSPPAYTLIVSDGTDDSAPSLVSARINATPVISSDGGGAAASLHATELNPVVTTVQATDPESSTVTYAIAGGTDASLFSINSSTGQLRFASTPDIALAPYQAHSRDYAVTVSASDGASSDTQALTVHLDAYNRPPINTLPSSFSALEETSQSLTGLSVTDSDAQAGDVATVTISVAHGILSVDPAVAGGLSSSGIAYSTDVHQVTLTGTLTAIDSTLAASRGLIYRADNDFSGTDTLTMVSDDMGHNGLAHTPAQNTTTDLAPIVVTSVNDAPVIRGNTLAIAQGGSAQPAIVIYDPDNTPGSLTISASNITAGRFVNTSSGLTVTQFTYAELQAGQILFFQDGTTTLPGYALVVSDGQASSSISNAAATLNLTPTITSLGGGAAASLHATELNPVVTTVQATDPESSTVTYAIAGGTDASLFSINSSTGQLRFASTPDIALAPYQAHSRDYAVTVSASDGASSDTQALTVHLDAYNRPPINTLPSSFSALEETSQSLTGLSVTDSDAQAGDVATVTISVAHGILSVDPAVAGGLSSSGIAYSTDVHQVTLTGTLTAIDSTLAASRGLIYRADNDFSGTDTLTMVSDDMGHNGLAHTPAQNTTTDLAPIVVTSVNDAPVIRGNTLAIAQGGSAQPAIVIYDPDNTPGSLTISASNITAGRFVNTSSGLTVTQFTYAELQAGQILFFQDGTTTLPGYALVVSDGQASSSISNAAATLNLTPTITSLGGGAAASLHATELNPVVTTVQATDPESSTVTYAIAGGTDASLFSINSSTGQLRFASTPDTGTALYQKPNQNYVVTVSASDGVTAASQTLTVHLDTYNRPPINTLPGSVRTQEDTPLALTGLHVADADVLSTDVVTVTLQVIHGTLSIDSTVTGGLSSTSIALSSDQRQLTLTGTLDVVNASLAATNALLYRPDADYNGSDTFTMASDDHGHNGLAHSPTQNTATDTATLTIDPVNDAPVIRGNTLTVIQGGTAQPVITITDVDNVQSSWMISASGITAGHFIDTTSGLSVTQFSADQVASGTIVFVHDGSLAKPGYTLTVSDGMDTSAPSTTVVSYQVYNQAPVNTLPSTARTQEDTPLALTGLHVADADALTTDAITVTLQVIHGTLSVDSTVIGGLSSSGITLSSDQRHVTLTGTLSAINATLAATNALLYTPDADANGSDTLTMVSDDHGHNGLAHSPTQNTATDTATLTIDPVNDAPVIRGNTLTVIQGGTAQPVITITDVDNVQSSWMISASGITAGHFIDTTSGLSVTQFSADQVASGTIVFVHDGSLARPGYTLTVSDGTKSSAPSTAIVGFRVYNQAPVNTLPGTARTQEDTPLALTGLHVADADALTTDAITVTLQVIHGKLSVDSTVIGGLSSSGITLSSDQRHVTLTGTLSAINATLAATNALLYTPDADVNGSDTLTMVSDDHGHNGLAHSPTQNTATDTATLTIDPVDDPTVVGTSTLTIVQGGSAAPTIILTGVDTAPELLMISAQDIEGGHFLQTQTQTEITEFSYAELTSGHVVFVQDSSNTAPHYQLTVSDGVTTTVLPATHATLVLADVPLQRAPTETKVDTPKPAPAPAPSTVIEASPKAAPVASPAAATVDATMDHGAAAESVRAPVEAPPIPLVGNGFALDTKLGNSVVKITFEPTPQRQLETVSTDFNFTPATSWNGFLQSKDAPEELRRNLEQLRDQLLGQELIRHQVVASSIALTSSLSVGYVIWLVRGGALIGSMLSAMPMWQMIDPLPVLTRTAGKRDTFDGNDSDASVEQIFDGDHSDDPEIAHPTASPEPMLASPEARE